MEEDVEIQEMMEVKDVKREEEIKKIKCKK